MANIDQNKRFKSIRKMGNILRGKLGGICFVHSIYKKIIDAHGGRIRVESKLRKKVHSHAPCHTIPGSLRKNLTERIFYVDLYIIHSLFYSDAMLGIGLCNWRLPDIQ